MPWSQLSGEGSGNTTLTSPSTTSAKTEVSSKKREPGINPSCDCCRGYPEERCHHSCIIPTSAVPSEASDHKAMRTQEYRRKQVQTSRKGKDHRVDSAKTTESSEPKPRRSLGVTRLFNLTRPSYGHPTFASCSAPDVLQPFLTIPPIKRCYKDDHRSAHRTTSSFAEEEATPRSSSGGAPLALHCTNER